jgi:hypothetical protein
VNLPLSSAFIVPNETTPLNNSIKVFASDLPLMVMIVLLVMLSLLLSPVSSTVANFKSVGASGALLSTVIVLVAAAGLLRFAMLPAMSMIVPTFIDVNLLTLNADDSGKFTKEITLTANSTTKISAKASDAIGNQSSVSTVLSITLDTVAPMFSDEIAVNVVTNAKKTVVLYDAQAVNDVTTIADVGHSHLQLFLIRWWLIFQ